MARFGMLSLTVFLVLAQTAALADEKPTYAGPTKGGFLLPNGWTVSPAGKQVELHDLPMNIASLANGKQVLVTSNGFNPHTLYLIDITTQQIVDRAVTRNSWFGLALAPKQDKLWWSGAGAGVLHTFDVQRSKLIQTSKPEPYPEKLTEKDIAQIRKDVRQQHAFRSGLTLDAAGHTLFSLDINQGTITALDAKDGKTKTSARCGGRPYDVVLSRNGAQLFVSDWAGRAVLALDPVSLRTVAKIQVGEHPNQMVLHPSDERLFVACSSSNWVSVIDTKRGTVTETIMTALFPRAPEGSTPDALAVAPDGKTLFVANADNNCVAVIDIATAGQSLVKGFIPTGWYPTAIAVTPDSQNLLVGVGKGNVTKANPIYKDAGAKDDYLRKVLPYPYIGTTLSGALSIIPVPDDPQLSDYTTTVYRNCPYSDQLLSGTPYPHKTAIPTKVGDPSPIKHVIYIIKENRTYDQVFGDMKKGNGDPALVMFGEKVTPNHHKLAEEFVLFDNLYCNGQVSRDGHPWSTMAYNTDYIARDWTLTYSSRRGVDDDDDDNLSKAPSGYLWDACARLGISYRSYGEYGHQVSTGPGLVKMEGKVPGLVGHMSPEYSITKAAGHVSVRDSDRVDVFLKEFHQYEKDGNLPQFIVMSLGEDHTTGTKPGTYTPEACVASNDLALGRLVEAVSESKYWPETAIFVIEDDAQNGPDHVDAHRTVGLVISPYARRHALDSTQYSTVSLLRTIELILGLPPLSQYDAAARPMFAAFTDQPELKPYQRAEAHIDLAAINPKTAYGAERSSRMDFREYDRVNEFELNEILWRSIKGADAPLPPAVRQAIANRPVELGK